MHDPVLNLKYILTKTITFGQIIIDMLNLNKVSVKHKLNKFHIAHNSCKSIDLHEQNIETSYAYKFKFIYP